MKFVLIHEHGEWVLVAKEKGVEKYRSEALSPHSCCSLLQTHGFGMHHAVGIKLRKPDKLLALVGHRKGVHLRELVRAAIVHDCQDKNDWHFVRMLEGYSEVAVWLLPHADEIVPDEKLRLLHN